MALAVVSEAELARAGHPGALGVPEWSDPEGWPEADGWSDPEGWPEADGWPDPDRWPDDEAPRLRLVSGRGPVHGTDDDPASGRIVALPLGVRATPRRRVSARVRRRRLLAVGMVVGATVLTVLPLSGLLGSARGAPPLVQAAETNLPTQTQAGQGTFYVVRPGDSLASIAQRIAPSNPGPVHADLVRLVGSDRVVAGEHIRLS
jgi:hypothetical protein